MGVEDDRRLLWDSVVWSELRVVDHLKFAAVILVLIVDFDEVNQ